VKVTASTTLTHNPWGEAYWASGLRENLTSRSYGEGLETGRTLIQAPRQSFTRQCYHKSLKQNVSLAKSPTQTVTTQTNHFFAALCGFIKLERLKGKTKLNHFALKTKLYFAALHSAFATLRTLTPVQGSA
jgi:hypothetical protein